MFYYVKYSDPLLSAVFSQTASEHFYIISKSAFVSHGPFTPCTQLIRRVNIELMAIGKVYLCTQQAARSNGADGQGCLTLADQSHAQG